MKSRLVRFSETAQTDLLDLEIWLESVAGQEIARRYVDRLIDQCFRLDIASERGSRHDDVRPGLRIVGFEKGASIAFEVSENSVNILRLFRAGRDWEAELSQD